MWSRRSMIFQAVVASLLLSTVSSFTVMPQIRKISSFSSSSALAADIWSGSSAGAMGGGAGSIEQIEFKIYPDGRVEETVRGVKGNNCHKVTEKINEALGEVIASAPTEEMFDQPVIVNQKVTLTDSIGGWEGSSTW